MPSVIDRIPLKPKLPVKSKNPKVLARQAQRLIEAAWLLNSVETLRLAIDWLDEVRERRLSALSSYEWLKAGYAVLSTPWYEAHLRVLGWITAAEAADPAAMKQIEREFDEEERQLSALTIEGINHDGHKAQKSRKDR